MNKNLIKKSLKIRKKFTKTYAELCIQLNNNPLKSKHKYKLVIKLKIFPILYEIILLFIF